MHETMIKSVELDTCKIRLMILDARTRTTITDTASFERISS